MYLSRKSRLSHWAVVSHWAVNDCNTLYKFTLPLTALCRAIYQKSCGTTPPRKAYIASVFINEKAEVQTRIYHPLTKDMASSKQTSRRLAHRRLDKWASLQYVVNQVIIRE